MSFDCGCEDYDTDFFIDNRTRLDRLEQVLKAAKALLESGCVNKDRQAELAKAIEEAR